MDLSVSADGKSLDWITDANEEFGQKAVFAAGFSRGTYRHDRNEGFPRITVLRAAETPAQLASLIRFFLNNRPGVAEVVSVTVEPGVERHFDYSAVVRLEGGTTTQEINFN